MAAIFATPAVITCVAAASAAACGSGPPSASMAWYTPRALRISLPPPHTAYNSDGTTGAAPLNILNCCVSVGDWDGGTSGNGPESAAAKAKFLPPASEGTTGRPSAVPTTSATMGPFDSAGRRGAGRA